MNTVGKAGQLGGGIRCVVSVSMLTEGWDANTVTHVLGIRAFGTQLLCEQVIGRALRRQSYDLNEEGLFNVEYADVFGIPFNFTAKPVISRPSHRARRCRSRPCARSATRWRFSSPAWKATGSSCPKSA
jgi:type III restriction enzyme